MILVAGGDSFIWGSELQDCLHAGPNGHSHNTFTALLAQQYDLDYVCAAYPGNSNSAIARSIMTACERFESQDKFVIVSWTFPHRFEFRFMHNDNSGESSWHSINSWQADGTLDKDYGEKINSKEVCNFAKIFFNSVANNEYYEQYFYLKEILFLQLYLKNKNIPYLFTTAHNESYQHINYDRHASDKDLNSLYNQIDWHNWYFFPGGKGADQTESPRGFYQWAVESKYKIAPQKHPIEDAHKDAAELIKEKFNEVVKEYL